MTFSILKNGVDATIEIIQHDDTGFYNISKIPRTDGVVMCGDAKVDAWLNDADAIERIEAFKRVLHEDMMMFVLDRGVSDEYKGTYVHKLLYDVFMSYYSSEYAIKVSMILSKRQRGNL